MAAAPDRAAIAGTPTNAEAKAGFGALWDYITGLLGTSGNPSDARTAMGFVELKPIAASVASNALTVTLNPTTLDFRSATLGSGTVNTRTISSAINAVVPSGATLGTANATLSKVMLLAIDNAGTVELAVCNSSLALDESSLISTTVIDGAADSASVIYSATARTNVPFRIVGFVESTQTTAGTWAAAPSKIQGIGGQIRSGDVAGVGLGYGQTWQNVTASRASGTIYYNTTGKPIHLVACWSAGGSGLTVNGSLIQPNTVYNICNAVIPVGASYSVVYGGTLTYWNELR